MFHTVQAVKPLPEFKLLVSFTNGEHKEYNVQPLLHKWEAFRTLSSVQGLFQQVKVDAGGYGISWNKDIDLSCDELYKNGVTV